MEWLNIRGMIFMIVIMIPNIIFAIRCRDGFENKYSNRALEIIEQTGRFCCLGFMVFNIPGTWFGWRSDAALAGYTIINALLVGIYCILWIILWKKNSVFRAMALSIIPSAVFLFSGIMCRSVLLIVSALIFAPAHILISYKNAK